MILREAWLLESFSSRKNYKVGKRAWDIGPSDKVVAHVVSRMGGPGYVGKGTKMDREMRTYRKGSRRKVGMPTFSFSGKPIEESHIKIRATPETGGPVKFKTEVSHSRYVQGKLDTLARHPEGKSTRVSVTDTQSGEVWTGKPHHKFPGF
jgi:hypothetical protein